MTIGINSDFQQPLSEKVWLDTYKWITDENVYDMFGRIAKHLAEPEKNKKYWEDKFYELISNRRYVAGGRVNSNAGTGLKGTSFINCFVSGFRGVNQDSIEGILEELMRQAQTLKSEGGYGFCIDVLRPRGAYIEGIGIESCGGVKFLDLWDTSSSVVTSGSGFKQKKGKNKARKGAMMVTMSIWHPSIEEFITAKRTEGKLTKFNMSCLITDKFMTACRLNKKWKLEFPDTTFKAYNVEWDGDLALWKSKKYPVHIYKTFENANELFDLILKSTYEYAEPGILFIDRINDMNNLWYCENIKATNPCFREGTLVTTKEGVYPIESLVGKDVTIYDGENWKNISNFRKTGEDKSIYRVNLHSGVYFDVTDYHEFVLEDGCRKKTLELHEGDRLEYNDTIETYGNFEAKASYLKGFLLGDGHAIRNKNSNKHTRGALWLYEPKFVCESKLKESLSELPVVNTYNGITSTSIGFTKYKTYNKTKRKFMQGIVARGDNLHKWCNEYKQNFPIEVFNWNKKSKFKFISGLLDADGVCLNSGGRFGYQFSSKHKEFIVNFLRLLNSIGVYGKISKDDRDKTITSPNGKTYAFNCTYRITISQKNALALSKKMDDIKGFGRLKSHSDKSVSYCPKFRYNKVVSVEKLKETSDVYCCTVDAKHKLLINSGIIIGQCGEQPLPIAGSCNLGAINLTQYINEDRTDYNYELLKENIGTMLRFQDNVNDLSKFPLQEQKDYALATRRVGIGYMGYGSSLYMMKIPYGSKESLEITEKLCSFVTNQLYQQSALLAKEKGSFPKYDKKKFLQSKFVNQALTEETISMIKKYGMRNSHLTTIAPTGNTSILSNNVSGGLEPIVSPKYIRTVISSSYPEGLLEPKNINWIDKTYLGNKIWEFIKEGKDTLLRTVLNNVVYKIDGNRGLTFEEEVYDYAVFNNLKEFTEDKKNDADYIKTIFNLSIDSHLSVMSVFGKYIDSSMSKTINLPNEISFKDFKSVYLDAYNSKIIRGVTTYRQGTMSSVVKVEEDKEETIDRQDAPKRPDKLDCDIHELTINGEKFIVLVGKLEDGSLYEIFVTTNDKNQLDLKKHKTGTIFKKGKGKYCLIFEADEDKVLIDNINKEFDPIPSTLARLISMSLRHGTKLMFVVDQLSKDRNFLGIERAISRVLKKYIKNGEKVVTSEECPECNGELTYQEGCKQCLNCSWSKCS